jgi:hypothetical protein
MQMDNKDCDHCFYLGWEGFYNAYYCPVLNTHPKKTDYCCDHFRSAERSVTEREQEIGICEKYGIKGDYE